jgi:hypothetical protein
MKLLKSAGEKFLTRLFEIDKFAFNSCDYANTLPNTLSILLK